MAASNINLLPIDLSAKSGIAKTAGLLRRVSMFALVLFIILGVLSGAFIIIYTIQLNSVINGNKALESQISTLEVTEQKTVIIKDRLQKIKGIESQPDIIFAVDSIKSIASSLPSGVSVSDANIDALGKTVFSFNVTDSNSLTTFLSNLVANSKYKTLTIKNFSFTPATGYLISFEATTK